MTVMTGRLQVSLSGIPIESLASTSTSSVSASVGSSRDSCSKSRKQTVKGKDRSRLPSQLPLTLESSDSAEHNTPSGESSCQAHANEYLLRPIEHSNVCHSYQDTSPEDQPGLLFSRSKTNYDEFPKLSSSLGSSQSTELVPRTETKTIISKSVPFTPLQQNFTEERSCRSSFDISISNRECEEEDAVEVFFTNPTDVDSQSPFLTSHLATKVQDLRGNLSISIRSNACGSIIVTSSSSALDVRFDTNALNTERNQDRDTLSACSSQGSVVKTDDAQYSADSSKVNRDVAVGPFLVENERKASFKSRSAFRSPTPFMSKSSVLSNSDEPLFQSSRKTLCSGTVSRRASKFAVEDTSNFLPDCRLPDNSQRFDKNLTRSASSRSKADELLSAKGNLRCTPGAGIPCVERSGLDTSQSLKGSNVSSTVSDIFDFKKAVTPIAVIPYVHSGYAAAAPLMIKEKKWMNILRRLMPEAYADVAGLIKHAATLDRKKPLWSGSKKRDKPALDPGRVMKWAENNPVVAAFGMLNSDSGRVSKVDESKTEDIDLVSSIMNTGHFDKTKKFRRKGPNLEPARRLSYNAVEKHGDKSQNPEDRSNVKPALEWDVFLDPKIVKDVDRAMQRLQDLRINCCYNSDQDDCLYDEVIAADIDVDRHVARLISRLMVAHGSTAQLLSEAVGMAPRYNFSCVVEQGESVRRTKRKRKVGLSRLKFESSSCLDDATLNKPYSVITSDIVSMSHSSMPTFDDDEEIEGRGPESVGAGGMFVCRWLKLFASALRLGSQEQERLGSECGLENSSDTEKVSRRYSHLSRGNGSLACIDDGVSVFNTLVQDDGDEEDALAIPPSICGLFLCLGMDDPNSKKADHANTSMAESAQVIKKLLNEPLRLVLDLKSRRVPPRVWARLVDNLRARGLEIDGLGSFDIEELRNIAEFICTPVTGVFFFHSAGDLQRACHANQIKKGDTVYFNAGSLIWRKPSLREAAGIGCCTPVKPAFVALTESVDDEDDLTFYGSKVSFQPYAFGADEVSKLTGFEVCKSTIQDYQIHFDLNIGVYVQEFSIGPPEIDALVRFINRHRSIYNLGLAWGGLNGYTVEGMQGDGFWNQRFVGRNWDFAAEPTNDMKLLAPEDHHIFQKVILAGSCGQVSTVNQIIEHESDELRNIPVRGMCVTSPSP